MSDYTWKQATAKDAEQFFGIIKKRISWMDEVGIRQWNVTAYAEAYPLEYYTEQARHRTLKILEQNGIMLGGAVLLENDDRWVDYPCETAYYIHNLASAPNAKGAGKVILRFIYEDAKKHSKTKIRLDCAADNPRLNAYYESVGYMPCGTCTDGPYKGIRRELIIK